MIEHDRRIGVRLRELRVAAGLSQQQLAERVGLTYQNLHKQEIGLTRISAGRLWRIAEELRVPPAAFFEDGEPLERTTRGEVALLRHYGRIASAEKRAAVMNLVKALAEE